MPDTRPPSELQALKGVGPKVERALNRLGLFSLRDVLFHFTGALRGPDYSREYRRFQTRGTTTISGRDYSQATIPGRRTQAVLTFEDVTGAARIRLFHFSRAYIATLRTANSVRIFGEPRIYQGVTEFIHPEIYAFKSEPPPLDNTLTPIYPTTEGLSQLKLRAIVQQALSKGPDFFALEELLNQDYTQHQPGLWEALTALHQPARNLPATACIERLAFEELLVHRLLLLTRREDYKRLESPQLKMIKSHNRSMLTKALPFDLTNAQSLVIREIDDDLMRGHPMLRLPQGDVGSGKTLVAALSALPVIDAGFQVALMAPTELLSGTTCAYQSGLAHWVSQLDG